MRLRKLAASAAGVSVVECWMVAEGAAEELAAGGEVDCAVERTLREIRDAEMRGDLGGLRAVAGELGEFRRRVGELDVFGEEVAVQMRPCGGAGVAVEHEEHFVRPDRDVQVEENAALGVCGEGVAAGAGREVGDGVGDEAVEPFLAVGAGQAEDAAVGRSKRAADSVAAVYSAAGSAGIGIRSSCVSLTGGGVRTIGRS